MGILAYKSSFSCKQNTTPDTHFSYFFFFNWQKPHFRTFDLHKANVDLCLLQHRENDVGEMAGSGAGGGGTLYLTSTSPSHLVSYGEEGTICFMSAQTLS